MTTSSVGSVLRSTTEQLATATNEVSATVSCQLSEDDIDRILDSNRDLVTEEFRGWHRRHLIRLGIDRYNALAKDARKEGRNKPKFFSFLLTRAT